MAACVGDLCKLTFKFPRVSSDPYSRALFKMVLLQKYMLHINIETIQLKVSVDYC